MRIVFLSAVTVFTCLALLIFSFESEIKSSSRIFLKNCAENQIAAKSKIDANSALLTALIEAESSHRQSAISPKGAIGLTQLMPSTAKELGVDPYDPVENLVGGQRYLTQMLDRFGDLRLALAAYNAGPSRISRLIAKHGKRYDDIKSKLPKETRSYVQRVLEIYTRIG